MWGISFRQKRLAADIAAFRVKVQRRFADQVPGAPPWADAVEKLLGLAEKAKDDKDIDAGWHYFNAAHRLGIYGLNDEEREAVAMSLRPEVEKKLSSSWRQKAALSLLDQKTKGGNIQVECLIEAMSMRDEHSENDYRRIYLVGVQLGVLAFSLIGTIALMCLLLVFFFGWKLPLNGLAGLEAQSTTSSLPFFGLVFLFGALGASLTTCLSLVRSPSQSPIPEQLLATHITLMRPLLGGVAAVAVYISLKAGLLNFLEVKLDNGAVIFALAFASGFTERLLMGAMEKISK